MKNNLFSALLVSLFIGSLLLNTGCSKKTVVPPSATTDATESGIGGGKNIPYPPSQGGYSENDLPEEGSLDDSRGRGGMDGGLDIDQQSDEYKLAHGRSSFNLSPIYFEFDQARISPAMTEVLATNAEYLNSVPGVQIVIEGNCDERGTNEYNLALGERRAINTQQFLIDMGVDQLRMRTSSYGEERPLFIGFDEEVYRQNRRVDFIVE